MSTDEVSDLRERMARVETKLDMVLERNKRWAAVMPAIISAVTSGVVIGLFKLITQAAQ